MTELKPFTPEILALPIEVQERIAIMTVDGEMSDNEALLILGYKLENKNVQRENMRGLPRKRNGQKRSRLEPVPLDQGRQID